jgi:hypothetical protein
VATLAIPESTERKKATFHLNLLIEQTDGMFVGWCIELGLSTAALVEDECVRKLIRLSCEQISFAMENDNPQDIFFSAPSTVVSKFLMMAKQAEPKSGDNFDFSTCNPLFGVSPTIYAATTDLSV